MNTTTSTSTNRYICRVRFECNEKISLKEVHDILSRHLGDRISSGGIRIELVPKYDDDVSR